MSQKVSPWTPLQHPLFRALWIAQTGSIVGSWMYDVGEAWLMVSLTPNPLLVSLLETANSLPMLLAALPAGALADILDRRRFLIFAQGWMAAVSAGLAVLTLLGWVSPWVILAFAFMLGTGAAMHTPAWQASIQDVVPRADLPAALTLGGVSVNLARTVGPAVGGVLVAATGPAAVFILNAVSFIVVIIVLYRWRRPKTISSVPPENFAGAVRAGPRYVRHSPALRAVLVRVFAFIFCGSAMIALLPLVARAMGWGAIGFGALTASFGAGSLAGVQILPRLRKRFSLDILISLATILFAAGLGTLAVTLNPILLCVAMLAAGAAWITTLSSLNVAAQMTTAFWVRARALAFYLLIFQGAIAVGSVLWGLIAKRSSVHTALLCASAGLLAGLATALRYRLGRPEAVDLSPSLHWPQPQMLMEGGTETGEILVTVEYRIDPQKSGEFENAMRELRRIRLRDGALDWRLEARERETGNYLESFTVGMWEEHLRQHERFTVADREVENRVRAFHRGPEPPVIRHLVARSGAAGDQPARGTDKV
jgi:predicted MFS family arabinose efflux permease